MGEFTVKDVARLSGVSVRALHHYDEIGLLRPAAVGANGYRYYGRAELLRLQQVLFHRELGFSLEEIRGVLDAADFDRARALRSHRARLLAQIRRSRTLVRTIDETLKTLDGETTMTETAMYRGFDPDKQARWEAELTATGGPEMRQRIDEAKAGMKGWSQEDFDALQEEAEAVEAGMVSALTAGVPATSPQVTQLMARHLAWVARQWGRRPSAEAFTGLGRMYVEHPEFRARYEARAPGLTEYLAAAMEAYAKTA